MNLKHTLLGLLLGVSFADAQLILNPGDVWTYSFTNLPFAGQFPGPGGPPPNGVPDIRFDQFENGARVQLEMFEEPAETIFLRSQIISNRNDLILSAFYGWQDRSGSIRLLMLTGTCSITGVTFYVYTQSGFNTTLKYGGAASLTSPPPRLTITPLPNAVQISWWTNGAAGYVLESTNTLTTGAWPAVAAAPILLGNRYALTTNVSEQRYFRLRK